MKSGNIANPTCVWFSESVFKPKLLPKLFSLRSAISEWGFALFQTVDLPYNQIEMDSSWQSLCEKRKLENPMKHPECMQFLFTPMSTKDIQDNRPFIKKWR